MTMYTYFSSVKSGKFLLRSNFWLNRKSCAYLAQSNPLWCVLSKPIGKLDKLEWYWTDKDTHELQTHEYILDTRDKLTDERYWEAWFPKKYRGVNYINKDVMSSHDNFFQCVDTILERDLITSPFALLGYTGMLGSEKMMQNMLKNKPNLNPPPHVIEELRKRYNIIPYKENIEHLAYNFFIASGRLPYDEQCQWINRTLEFQRIIPIILQRYNIPYEMFSLDSGDYAVTFGLDKTLPRDSSDTLFQAPNPKAHEEVKKYMDTYHSV